MTPRKEINHQNMLAKNSHGIAIFECTTIEGLTFL